VSTQMALDNFQYGVFGELQSANTSIFSGPFGFTGRWGGYTDNRLGQVLNWNRWYGPEAGRWGSRDPIGVSGGANFQIYSSNDPIDYLDPNGLEQLDYNQLTALVHDNNRTATSKDPGLSDQALLCIAWHGGQDQSDPGSSGGSAMGLMQITTATADYAQKYKKSGVSYGPALLNPATNLIVWSKSYRGQVQTYGNSHDALEKGVAGGAYPGFAGKVEKCEKCLKERGLSCSTCFQGVGRKSGNPVPKIPCDHCN
jgi:RHS repeat-associated protein